MGQLLDELLRDVGLSSSRRWYAIHGSRPSPATPVWLGPGSLFVGLPGERVDGGLFWRQALNAGAAAAVIGPAAAAADPPGDSLIALLLCPIQWPARLVSWRRRFGTDRVSAWRCWV